jgi:hypothetical protein
MTLAFTARCTARVSYINADTLNEETQAGDMPYCRMQLKSHDCNLPSHKMNTIQPGMTQVSGYGTINTPNLTLPDAQNLYSFVLAGPIGATPANRPP